MQVPAELFQTPAALFKAIKNPQFLNHTLKDGILRIERRWVENTLPDHELLDAVAIAFGRISELVHDAHRQLGLPPPRILDGDDDVSAGHESRGGRLTCMVGHGTARSLQIWLATGNAMEVQAKPVTIKRTKAATARVKERYAFSGTPIFAPVGAAMEEQLGTLFESAKRVFLKDGHHITLCFYFSNGRLLRMAELRIDHHGQKYAVMREVANSAINLGADSIIQIREVWSAPYDPSKPFQRSAESPMRREYLSAVLVRKDGEPVERASEILRAEKALSLGITREYRDQAQFAFAPLYEAWGRPIPSSWRNMHNITARDGIIDRDSPQTPPDDTSTSAT
jgi:hypothetical protein